MSEHTITNDLGLGPIEIIVRTTQPDGTVYELAIHRLIVDPGHPDHKAEFIHRITDMGGVNGIVRRPEPSDSRHEAELHFVGRLEVPEGGGTLYQIRTIPTETEKES